MSEQELENKVVSLIYKVYKTKGNPVNFNMKSISVGIPGSNAKQVKEVCKSLQSKDYISCIMLTNDEESIVKDMTYEGRKYAESHNLIGEPPTLAQQLFSDNTGEAKETKPNPVSDITLEAKASYPMLKDKSVPPCFGVERLADCFLKQLDSIVKDPDGNFCMGGIFAPWGRGKTYFFNKLKDRIKERNENDYEIKYDIVEFNAWKYQSTPAIWAYLYERLYEGKSRFFKFFYTIYHNIGNIFNDLLYSLIPLFICFLYNLIPDELLTAVSEGLPENVNQLLGVFVSSIVFIYKLGISKYNDASALMKDISKEASFEKLLGVQAEVEKEIEKLFCRWIPCCMTDKRKILLYVDDIDRCGSVKMVEIIESLRIIFENNEIRKRLVVICSIDSQKLADGIKEKYKTSSTPDHIVNDQMDKYFITSIGLNKLSKSQIYDYIYALSNNNGKDKESQIDKRPNTNNITDPSRIFGSFVPVTGGVVMTVNDQKISELLIECLKEIDEPITPRKARILYYRIMMANNIISTNEGAILTKEFVNQIVKVSLHREHLDKIVMDEALSDVIEMVAPY